MCVHILKKMTERGINLQWYAMHFGTYMGLFWIGKFILLPTGFGNPTMLYLFVILTLAVPFVGYRYARAFRNNVCGGTINFIQSWVFLFFMYLFAALLAAMAHYIYFRFFDNGLFINTYATSMEGLESVPELHGLIDPTTLKATISVLRTFTPIELTMQWFTSNMFWGSIIALITALFVAKK